MQLSDILGWVASIGFFGGFLVSFALALIYETGRRRQMAALALLCAACAIGTMVLHYGFGFDYATRRNLERYGFVLGLATMLFTYLGHTYWPARQKWVTQSATIGVVISFISVAILVIL